jgi:hypothetical protein
MKRNYFVGMILIGFSFFSSCNNTVNTSNLENKLAENKIRQQDDGTISLKIDKAECYSDVVNPSSNTAEWQVVVSRSGRYNVWLSSATKDTTDLQYKNSVRLNIHDEQLEAKPLCDKVIQNSGDVSKPYFRADSFMGSLYIQDTGHYNIQVISDKILPDRHATSSEDHTKLLSVFLTPVKH